MFQRKQNQTEGFVCIPTIQLMQKDVNSLFYNRYKGLVRDAKGQIPDVILQRDPIILKYTPYEFSKQLLIFDNNLGEVMQTGYNSLMVGGIAYNPIEDTFILDELRMINSSELTEKLEHFKAHGWHVTHIKINPPMTKEEEQQAKTENQRALKGESLEEGSLEAQVFESLKPKVGF